MNTIRYKIGYLLFNRTKLVGVSRHIKSSNFQSFPSKASILKSLLSHIDRSENFLSHVATHIFLMAGLACQRRYYTFPLIASIDTASFRSDTPREKKKNQRKSHC